MDVKSKVVLLRLKKLTYAKIAQQTNLSSERVRQILNRFIKENCIKSNAKVKTLHQEPLYSDRSFSLRVRNILSNANISTIEQLENMTTDDLRILKNCGTVSILEIKLLLSKRGKHLKDDTEKICNKCGQTLPAGFRADIH